MTRIFLVVAAHPHGDSFGVFTTLESALTRAREEAEEMADGHPLEEFFPAECTEDVGTFVDHDGNSVQIYDLELEN